MDLPEATRDAEGSFHFSFPAYRSDRKFREEMVLRFPSLPGPAVNLFPPEIWLWVKTRIPFWGLGEFTTQFRTYFSGAWDVHWAHGLDFDPGPFGVGSSLAGSRQLRAHGAGASGGAAGAAPGAAES